MRLCVLTEATDTGNQSAPSVWHIEVHLSITSESRHCGVINNVARGNKYLRVPIFCLAGTTKLYLYSPGQLLCYPWKHKYMGDTYVLVSNTTTLSKTHVTTKLSELWFSLNLIPYENTYFATYMLWICWS